MTRIICSGYLPPTISQNDREVKKISLKKYSYLYLFLPFIEELGRLKIIEKRFFSCEEAALEGQKEVCLCVCPSVCPQN